MVDNEWDEDYGDERMTVLGIGVWKEDFGGTIMRKVFFSLHHRKGAIGFGVYIHRH
jgi:hypothetical protein